MASNSTNSTGSDDAGDITVWWGVALLLLFVPVALLLAYGAVLVISRRRAAIESQRTNEPVK
jgi:hypothetical protein